MKARKWLFACLLAGLVLLPVGAAGIEPNDVLKEMGTRVGSVQCRSNATAAVIQSEDKKWIVVLMAKTGKIIMVEKDEEGNDVRVVFGKVWLAGRELKLEIQFSLTAEEANKKYPHPCDFLAPLEA